jgi:hypothetical protein
MLFTEMQTGEGKLSEKEMKDFTHEEKELFSLVVHTLDGVKLVVHVYSRMDELQAE